MVKNWRARLGPVPAANANGHRASVALVRADEDPLSEAYREAVRALRNSILLADFDRRVHSLLITSASPGEGKSTIAAHLALTHAAQRQRTLLIDGDLRRPSLHRRFQMPASIGLSSVLMSDIPWRDAVLRAPGMAHLDILPAGPPSYCAAGLMGQGLAQLLREAAAEYDLIVLDAPPLLGFAEPLEMATAVDGVVVVTRAGKTSRQAAASVLAMLARLRANTLGVVLNEVRQDTSESYYYYADFAKYYRAGGKRAAKNA
jgi:capsular exopolysaccharide synthesis family protein